MHGCLVTKRHKFVWIEMPEGRYLARVSWWPNELRRISYDIEMIDPVPNKLGDMCFGEMGSVKRRGVSMIVLHFIQNMIADRKKYGWSGRRLLMSRSWRLERLQEVLGANMNGQP